MSSQEVKHENGPTSKGYGTSGEGGGGGMFEDEEEESDSTLPPIRTPGSITKVLECVCVCVCVWRESLMDV